MMVSGTPALRNTDSQLLWCSHSWTYEAINTRMTLYYRVVLHPGEQRGQDRAPSTVCVGILMLVRPCVGHHLLGPPT